MKLGLEENQSGEVINDGVGVFGPAPLRCVGCVLVSLCEEQMATVGLLARMRNEFNRLISVNNTLFQLTKFKVLYRNWAEV